MFTSVESRTIALFLLVLGVLAMPTTANATRKTSNVVIVGDSVANVLRWAPGSMKPLWKSQYNVIIETWGCQQLLNEGCNSQTKLSSLDRIVNHRKDNIDVYIVATGYNDTGPAYLAMAMRKIEDEVKQQGAALIWLTYQENGNVKIKNRAFNKVVRAQQKKMNMELLDWELISRKNKRWFSGDSVHMNRSGGLQFARHIKKALDLHYGRQITDTPTTTINPTTTISGVGQ